MVVAVIKIHLLAMGRSPFFLHATHHPNEKTDALAQDHVFG
jgi:hypothetical protein